jgi:hypothetical membrane protein
MRDRTRTGAFLWVLSLQFFAVQAIVQSAWSTPFSLAHNMISDLGRATCGPLFRAPGIDAACSPWHLLMNLSIMLNGVLIPAGALLTRRWWPGGRSMTAALWMIAATAPAHFLVGLFPSDTGPLMHMIGAGIILALANPGMVLAGISAWRQQRAAAVIAAMLGVLGIAGTLLFLRTIDLGIGLGGMERVAFYPLPLWSGITGVMLLLQPPESSRSPTI